MTEQKFTYTKGVVERKDKKGRSTFSISIPKDIAKALRLAEGVLVEAVVRRAGGE